MALNFVGLSGLSPSSYFLSCLAKSLGKDGSEFGILNTIMDTFLVRVVCTFIETRYAQLFTWIQRKFKPDVPVSKGHSASQTEDVSQYLKWSLNGASTLYMLCSNGYQLYQSVFSVHKVIWIALTMLVTSIGGWLIILLTALQKIAYEWKEYFRSASRAVGSQAKAAYNQHELQDIDANGVRAKKLNWASSLAISQALGCEESKNQNANLAELLKGTRTFIMVMCGTSSQGLSYKSLSPLVDLLIHLGDGIRFFSRLRLLYPWVICGKLFSAIGLWKQVSKKPQSIEIPSHNVSSSSQQIIVVERSASPARTPGNRSQLSRNFTVMESRRGDGATQWLIQKYKQSHALKAILKYNHLKDLGWQIALSTWFEGDTPTVGRIRDMVRSEQFKQTCNEIFRGCRGWGSVLISDDNFYDYFIRVYSQCSNAYNAIDFGSDRWKFSKNSERSFFFFGLCIPLLVASKMGKVKNLYIDDDAIREWDDLLIDIDGIKKSFLDFSVKILSDIDASDIHVTLCASSRLLIKLSEQRVRCLRIRPSSDSANAPASIRRVITTDDLNTLDADILSSPGNSDNPTSRGSPTNVAAFNPNLSLPNWLRQDTADDDQEQGWVTDLGTRAYRSGTF